MSFFITSEAVRVIVSTELSGWCKDSKYQDISTLKCLSIGTLKTIDIPHISNGKFMVFRAPDI